VFERYRRPTRLHRCLLTSPAAPVSRHACTSVFTCVTETPNPLGRRCLPQPALADRTVHRYLFLVLAAHRRQRIGEEGCEWPMERNIRAAMSAGAVECKSLAWVIVDTAMQAKANCLPHVSPADQPRP